MTARKLSLTALLGAIDRCDGDWLSRQSEEDRKDFVPLVIMRFVATVADGREAAYMLWCVNERVNGHLFDFSKHPDLIFRLLASCGLGDPLRHPWLAGSGQVPQANAASKLLLEHHPEASDREIAMLLSKYDRAGFIQFIGECGVQTADAKNVVKDYDKIIANNRKSQN